jgi:PhnB protein
MYIQPYLFFDGRCQEALDYYVSALGAKVEMSMRFKDSPQPAQHGQMPPGSENNVMHASFRIGDTVVMASDGYGKGKPVFQGFALSLSVTSPAEADRYFSALAKGGTITQPLTQTFFSHSFGMVTDKFGVPWMVVVEHKPQ